MYENRRDIKIENAIEKLPKGNITYKTIRGKRRMYLQWYEDGVKKSSYVKKADEEDVINKVKRRKELEKILKSTLINDYEDTELTSLMNTASTLYLSDIEKVNTGAFYENLLVMNQEIFI